MLLLRFGGSCTGYREDPLLEINDNSLISDPGFIKKPKLTLWKKLFDTFKAIIKLENSQLNFQVKNTDTEINSKIEKNT